MYEKGIDLHPIYKGFVDSSEPKDDDENLFEQTGFAYESDLRDFLAKNLALSESGLCVFQDEGISGIEFPVGGRFIDILATDKQNNNVVIELKVSKGYDRVIGQLLRYMAWIEKKSGRTSSKGQRHNKCKRNFRRFTSCCIENPRC